MIGPVPAAAALAAVAFDPDLTFVPDDDVRFEWTDDVDEAQAVIAGIAFVLARLFERDPAAWALVVGMRKVPGAFVYRGERQYIEGVPFGGWQEDGDPYTTGGDYPAHNEGDRPLWERVGGEG